MQARVTGSAPAGQFITGISANGNVTVAPDTTDWKLAGNNVSAGQFLGSTNNQAVTIKVNGLQALQISPLADDAAHSNMVNVTAGSPVNYIAPGVYGSVIAGGGASLLWFGNLLRHETAWPQICRLSVAVGGNFIGTNAYLSVIGGGVANSIGTYSSESVVSAGTTIPFINMQTDPLSGGGYYNFIDNSAAGSVIVGGGGNHVQLNAWNATVVGGYGNHILSNARYGFIGGQVNTISNAVNATVGGGELNWVAADNGSIGGGYYNSVSDTNGTVAGGYGNQILPSIGDGSIGGGHNNLIQSQGGVIAGGIQSHILGPNSPVATMVAAIRILSRMEALPAPSAAARKTCLTQITRLFREAISIPTPAITPLCPAGVTITRPVLTVSPPVNGPLRCIKVHLYGPIRKRLGLLPPPTISS